jgi:hypothetical protein
MSGEFAHRVRRFDGTGNEKFRLGGRLNFGIHGVTRGGVQRVVHKPLLNVSRIWLATDEH